MCLLVHGQWWLGGVCICVQVAVCVHTGWGRAGVYAESFVAAGMRVGVQMSCVCPAMYVQMCVYVCVRTVIGAYSGMCAEVGECICVGAYECTQVHKVNVCVHACVRAPSSPA